MEFNCICCSNVDSRALIHVFIGYQWVYARPMSIKSINWSFYRYNMQNKWSYSNGHINHNLASLSGLSACAQFFRLREVGRGPRHLSLVTRRNQVLWVPLCKCATDQLPYLEEIGPVFQENCLISICSSLFKMGWRWRMVSLKPLNTVRWDLRLWIELKYAFKV